MREGLKMMQLAGRYGYSVTLVGWMRQVRGDEWEIVGQRTLGRLSGQRSLSELAADGPKSDHVLGAAAQYPEEIHRLLIRRSMLVNLNVWEPLCPKPKGWVEK